LIDFTCFTLLLVFISHSLHLLSFALRFYEHINQQKIENIELSAPDLALLTPNGEYSRQVYRFMIAKLEIHLSSLETMKKKIQDFRPVTINDESVLELINIVQEALDVIQPDNPITCFFSLKIVYGFQWFLHLIGNFFYAIIWALWWVSSKCREPLRRFMWLIIALIYIAGIYNLDRITESYILVNPSDLYGQMLVDFQVSSIHNCSQAPVGQPVLMRYSHKFLTSYAIVAYGISIGLVIRNISEQQASVYDWVTMDELLDHDNPAHQVAINAVARINSRMSADTCQALYMDMLSKLCMNEFLLNPSCPAGAFVSQVVLWQQGTPSE
jgi:hypothetical protein